MTMTMTGMLCVTILLSTQTNALAGCLFSELDEKKLKKYQGQKYMMFFKSILYST